MKTTAIMLVFGVILEFLIGAFQYRAEEQISGRNRKLVFRQQYGESLAALAGFGASTLCVASYLKHASIASSLFILRLGLCFIMLVCIGLLAIGFFFVSMMGAAFATALTEHYYGQR